MNHNGKTIKELKQQCENLCVFEMVEGNLILKGGL